MLFVEGEEGGEGEGGRGSGGGGDGVQSVDISKEESREGVDTSQIYHLPTATTIPLRVVNPPSRENHVEQNGEERRFTETNCFIDTSGGKCGKTFVQSESTNVSQTQPPGEASRPVVIAGGEVVFNEETLRRVVESAAKEYKAEAEKVWATLEKALQYFDTYHSVGAIRVVEDLRRLTKADEKTVKVALDVLRGVGLLEYREPGVYNYKAVGQRQKWAYKAKQVLETH